MMEGCRASGDLLKTIIEVKVLPRSSQNEIVGKAEGVFKVKVTAPPVEGKANKALIELLSGKLGVAKRDVTIVSGERSKKKTVLLFIKWTC